ncbi:MAG: TIGR04282 family arsenosugar biosynthesis glycosyltransferase [Gemmatimonadota bacterium]
MSQAVVVFAKAPEPGRVKTRLQPDLTAADAAAVYEACLVDVVQMLRRLGVDLHIDYVDSLGAREYFAESFPDLPLSRQSAGDLGTRMAATCDRLFGQGFGSVLVIGSDIPTLPPEHVEDALALVRRCGVVFGPTSDGGYYLVAIDRSAWPSARALFEDVPWSTPEVLDRSIAQARSVGLAARLVEPWYDLDGIGDLRRAAGDAAPGSRLALWVRDRGIGPSAEE